MSFLTPDQRYNMLCAIKHGHDNPNLPKGPLTTDEERFVQDYAWEKLQKTLSDPEVMAVFERLKDK